MNTHHIVNTEELPLQVTRAIRRLLIINPHYIVRKEDPRIMAMLQINLDTNSDEGGPKNYGYATNKLGHQLCRSTTPC